MQRSRYQHLWKKTLSNKPIYSLSAVFQSNKHWITHNSSQKSSFNIFSVVYLATASAVCPSKLVFCLNPSKPYFLWLSVKHFELRTPGQRSSKRVCGNDRTSFQAITALLWNDSTQIQFFLSNWYVLLIEKSNLKGQAQMKRNPINRNEFQI